MKEKKNIGRNLFVLILAVVLIGFGLHTVLAAKNTPTRTAINTDTPMIPADFSSLAEMARPGVVNIRTVKTIKGGGPVFRQFFGNPFGGNSPFPNFPGFSPRGAPHNFKQESLGSGFILDREGDIATNNHVIDGADKIRVRLYNGKEFNAKVIGRDPKTDLALIKIPASSDLTPLKLGNSDHLKVGNWVIAIGSPFGLDQTVTAGIVSAKGRAIGDGPYDDFIQTDASINPGNSGGPLLNMKGEVVGINTAIMSKSGDNDGIGFAIPINLASGILKQLKENGKVSRAWLGVGIQDLTPDLAKYYKTGDQKGVLVTQVFPGEPADRAGIKTGDIILSVDGKKVSSSRELSMTIANAKAGKKTDITVLRDGRKHTISVVLASRSNSGITQTIGPAERPDDLGVQVANVNPETARQLGLPENAKGVLVTQVDPDGKAASAGLQKGDLITGINRRPVQDVKDFKKQLEEAGSGKNVQLLVMRPNAGFLVVQIPA